MYHQGRIRGNSSIKLVATCGMIHISIEFALMDCYEDVSQWKKPQKSWIDVMHHPIEDIMEHSVHMLKFGKVDSSGQRCIKIQRSLSKDVPDAKSMETLMLAMQCHSRTSSKWSYLMFGKFLHGTILKV
jgi:hypothetical protein